MTFANARIAPVIPADAIGGERKCTGCNSNPRQNQAGESELVVETLHEIPYEGQVVLCATCIRFLGNFIGLIDPEKGKARASDVKRHERRETKIRAASAARDTAAYAAAALTAALAELDEIL